MEFENQEDWKNERERKVLGKEREKRCSPQLGWVVVREVVVSGYRQVVFKHSILTG